MSESEEEYLYRVLSELHASYMKDAGPYIQRLCLIQAMRLPTPGVVTATKDMSLDWLMQAAGIVPKPKIPSDPSV